MNRRTFLTRTMSVAAGTPLLGQMSAAAVQGAAAPPARPNILFAIADDWSWPYVSVAGTKGVHTPNFDRVAREGVLFHNAFVAAPQCSPNRASILTGRYIWQNEEAGTHASIFPNKFPVFTDLLEAAGYHVGYTGKGWGPGDWERGGWRRNPAGILYNERKLDSVPAEGIQSVDYAGNFEDFLAKRIPGQPFCFWYGAHEPHRRYEAGSGVKAGKKLEDAHVPDFLPDGETVRSDILDHCIEIEWFDEQLGRMLARLEALGELDNTVVVVTGDNGMPFPGAKANLHEHGIHAPLAVRWPARIRPGRMVEDFVSHVDLAPTFLEAAGLDAAPSMAGRSFLDVLESEASGQIDPYRTFILAGRERHTHARYDNLGYPGRAVRTADYLYIHNMKPDRWPAGDPQGDPQGGSEGYMDIDPCPAKSFMLEHRAEYPAEFARCFEKRPEVELYAVAGDSACMKNLAGAPEHAEARARLGAMLGHFLTATKDPRALGFGDIFESYPRVSSPMRPYLGGFAEQGEYNPGYQRR